MFQHLRTPDFDRLRRNLFNEKTAEYPLLELGIHPKIKAEILGREITSVKDDIEFMSSMGYDFIKLQPIYQFEKERQEKRRGGMQQRDAGAPDRAWASEHEGVVQTWEDFEKYAWPKKENISYANFEEAARLLPDNIKVIGQYGDIFTSTWEMMGFETFSMAMFEDPELVDAIMEKLAGLVLSMFETMAQMDIVGALWYSDDIAYTGGLMVSPDFLRTNFFPRLRQIGDDAKAAGKPLLYHTDGVLWDVFDDIIDAGVTAQHPIEPKAMDIGEVKDRVGDRLCVCGNVDVDTLSRGTPADIAEIVRERFEKIGGRPGWCIGSSNSVPDYAKTENYIAMVETALNMNKAQA